MDEAQYYLREYIIEAVREALNNPPPDFKYFEQTLDLIKTHTLQLDISFFPKHNDPAPKHTYFVLTTEQIEQPFLIVKPRE